MIRFVIFDYMRIRMKNMITFYFLIAMINKEIARAFYQYNKKVQT